MCIDKFLFHFHFSESVQISVCASWTATTTICTRTHHTMSSSHPLKLDVVDDELRREKRGKQLATAAVDTMNDVRAIERAKKAQDLVELKLTMKMTDGALSLSEFKHSLPLLSAASLARIEHERHLADLCAYPTCSNRPRGAYGSARDTLRIDRISLSVYSQKNSTDIAFCGSVCQQRAQWARTRCVGKVESDTSLLVDRNPHQRVKLLEEWGVDGAMDEDTNNTDTYRQTNTDTVYTPGDIVEHPPSSTTANTANTANNHAHARVRWSDEAHQ